MGSRLHDLDINCLHNKARSSQVTDVNDSRLHSKEGESSSLKASGLEIERLESSSLIVVILSLKKWMRLSESDS